MIRQCSFCGNVHIKKNKVQYIHKHQGKFFIVNDVPCEQCEFCGEQYFEAPVLKKIEKDFELLNAHQKKPEKEITIPMEQFAM